MKKLILAAGLLGVSLIVLPGGSGGMAADKNEEANVCYLGGQCTGKYETNIASLEICAAMGGQSYKDAQGRCRGID